MILFYRYPNLISPHYWCKNIIIDVWLSVRWLSVLSFVILLCNFWLNLFWFFTISYSVLFLLFVFLEKRDDRNNLISFTNTPHHFQTAIFYYWFEKDFFFTGLNSVRNDELFNLLLTKVFEEKQLKAFLFPVYFCFMYYENKKMR